MSTCVVKSFALGEMILRQIKKETPSCNIVQCATRHHDIQECRDTLQYQAVTHTRDVKHMLNLLVAANKVLRKVPHQEQEVWAAELATAKGDLAPGESIDDFGNSGAQAYSIQSMLGHQSRRPHSLLKVFGATCACLALCCRYSRPQTFDCAAAVDHTARASNSALCAECCRGVTSGDSSTRCCCGAVGAARSS